MGLRLFDSPAIPGLIALELECDAQRGMFPCTVKQTFNEGHYLANIRKATAKGWLERQESSGRLFLCPACSGKKVKQ